MIKRFLHPNGSRTAHVSPHTFPHSINPSLPPSIFFPTTTTITMHYYEQDPNYFMDYPFPVLPPAPPQPPQLAMPEPNWKNNKSSAAEVAPNCPRCASSNTKFCYYNNYSFSQPRYFCKSCRRYWTKGGSLRSVPVGGGCRKTRRSRAARPSPYQRPGSVTSDSDQTSSSDPEASVGSDIDLAAVFANYLNPNLNPNPKTSAHAEEPAETRTGSALASEETVGPSPSATFSEDQDVEFVGGHDSGSYGLDSMMNGDFTMWPDEANLGGLDWQPMVDLVEECGSFSSEEISKVLIDDNWSLFDDLSGCL